MIIKLEKYTVTAKDELTWGDAEKIQATIQSGAKIKGTVTDAGNSGFEFDTNAMLEAKYVTLERTITKIEDKDGKEESFTRDWIDNLSIADGNKLYEAVNELTKKV